MSGPPSPFSPESIAKLREGAGREARPEAGDRDQDQPKAPPRARRALNAGEVLKRANAAALSSLQAQGVAPAQAQGAKAHWQRCRLQMIAAAVLRRGSKAPPPAICAEEELVMADHMLTSKDQELLVEKKQVQQLRVRLLKLQGTVDRQNESLKRLQDELNTLHREREECAKAELLHQKQEQLRSRQRQLRGLSGQSSPKSPGTARLGEEDRPPSGLDRPPSGLDLDEPTTPVPSAPPPSTQPENQRSPAAVMSEVKMLKAKLQMQERLANEARQRAERRAREADALVTRLREERGEGVQSRCFAVEQAAGTVREVFESLREEARRLAEYVDEIQDVPEQIVSVVSPMLLTPEVAASIAEVQKRAVALYPEPADADKPKSQPPTTVQELLDATLAALVRSGEADRPPAAKAAKGKQKASPGAALKLAKVLKEKATKAKEVHQEKKDEKEREKHTEPDVADPRVAELEELVRTLRGDVDEGQQELKRKGEELQRVAESLGKAEDANNGLRADSRILRDYTEKMERDLGVLKGIEAEVEILRQKEVLLTDRVRELEGLLKGTLDEVALFRAAAGQAEAMKHELQESLETEKRRQQDALAEGAEGFSALMAELDERSARAVISCGQRNLVSSVLGECRVVGESMGENLDAMAALAKISGRLRPCGRDTPQAAPQQADHVPLADGDRVCFWCRWERMLAERGPHATPEQLQKRMKLWVSKREELKERRGVVVRKLKELASDAEARIRDTMPPAYVRLEGSGFASMGDLGRSDVSVASLGLAIADAPTSAPAKDAASARRTGRGKPPPIHASLSQSSPAPLSPIAPPVCVPTSTGTLRMHRQPSPATNRKYYHSPSPRTNHLTPPDCRGAAGVVAAIAVLVAAHPRAHDGRLQVPPPHLRHRRMGSNRAASAPRQVQADAARAADARTATAPSHSLADLGDTSPDPYESSHDRIKRRAADRRRRDLCNVDEPPPPLPPRRQHHGGHADPDGEQRPPDPAICGWRSPREGDDGGSAPPFRLVSGARWDQDPYPPGHPPAEPLRLPAPRPDTSVPVSRIGRHNAPLMRRATTSAARRVPGRSVPLPKRAVSALFRPPS